MAQPIDIIKSSTVASNDRMLDELMDVIRSVYRYELFKPLMDLSATLALNKRLKLVAQPKEFYMLDEGNCVTIESGAFDKIANVFKRNKNFTVTIKKISADVLIHELGHMLEKEIDVDLDQEFMQCVYSDISIKHSHNVSLNSAVKQVMIDEVKNYPKNQQPSELFTRYFQLLAMSIDVSGFSASYGYKIDDVYKAFPSLNKWIGKYLNPLIAAKLDPEIIAASIKYIVALSEIKHEWSDQKIKPIHSPKTNPQSKWSSTLKSIKD